jgi:hypothetical protein
MTACCCVRTASARSASKNLARRFASITAMSRDRCAGCCVADATWGLDTLMTIPGCSGRRPRIWTPGGRPRARIRRAAERSRLLILCLAINLTFSCQRRPGRRRPSRAHDLGCPKSAVTPGIPAQRSGRAVPLSPALGARDTGQPLVQSPRSRNRREPPNVLREHRGKPDRHVARLAAPTAGSNAICPDLAVSRSGCSPRVGRRTAPQRPVRGSWCLLLCKTRSSLMSRLQ